MSKSGPGLDKFLANLPKSSMKLSKADVKELAENITNTQTAHTDECLACEHLRLVEERQKNRKLRKTLRFAQDAIRANLIYASKKDEVALLNAFNAIKDALK